MTQGRTHLHIDIASASIADVFAHLLEVQGHSGIYPDKPGKYGNASFPHAHCNTSRGRESGRYRGRCAECIALRKYRLDAGETEEDQEWRWNVQNARPGLEIKIGDKA